MTKLNYVRTHTMNDTRMTLKIVKMPEGLQHLVGREVEALYHFDNGHPTARPLVVCHPDDRALQLTLTADQVDSRVVSVPVAVSLSLVDDILAMAAEGGIDHWARVRNYKCQEGNAVLLHIYETDENGMVPEGHGGKQFDYFDGIVTYDMVSTSIEKIVKGLLTISQTTRANLIRSLMEDDAAHLDANDADSIVQIAALGDIVYG